MKIRELLTYALRGMQWSALAIVLVAMLQPSFHAFKPLAVTLLSGAVISVGFIILNNWDRLPIYMVFILHYVWTATVSVIAGLLTVSSHPSLKMILSNWGGTLIVYVIFIGSIFLYAFVERWYRNRQKQVLEELNERNHERQKQLDEKNFE